MYTRTIIYRAFSIIILIAAGISLASSIVFAANIGNLSGYLPGNLKSITGIITVILVISSLLSFLLSYFDFSSMYVFADLIDYEKSKSTMPFKKKAFIFPAKLYIAYGNLIFTIVFILSIIAAAICIITSSVQHKDFISLPVIPLLGNFLTVVFCYIQYLARFKGIGDLMDILSATEPTQKHLESLQGYKTGLLRGYCVFLFIVDTIFAIGIIIALFALYNPMVTLLGSGITFTTYIMIIFASAILILSNAVYGCFYDNLAKMIEHYQIKYKLI